MSRSAGTSISHLKNPGADLVTELVVELVAAYGSAVSVLFATELGCTGAACGEVAGSAGQIWAAGNSLASVNIATPTAAVLSKWQGLLTLLQNNDIRCSAPPAPPLYDNRCPSGYVPVGNDIVVCGAACAARRSRRTRAPTVSQSTSGGSGTSARSTAR